MNITQMANNKKIKVVFLYFFALLVIVLNLPNFCLLLQLFNLDAPKHVEFFEILSFSSLNFGVDELFAFKFSIIYNDIK